MDHPPINHDPALLPLVNSLLQAAQQEETLIEKLVNASLLNNSAEVIKIANQIARVYQRADAGPQSESLKPASSPGA